MKMFGCFIQFHTS